MIENGGSRIAAAQALPRSCRSIINLPSSIFDVLASPVALTADHVDHTESRNNIRHHVTFDHLVKGAHGDETGRAHSDAIGSTAAVANNIEAQLTVASFYGRIGFTWRHMDAFHNDFEMMHQPFDAVINFFLFRQRDARIVNPNRTYRNLLQRLIHNLHALFNFQDAADKAIVVITSTPQGYIEIELVIDQVRMGFAHVVVDAGGTQNRTGEAIADGSLLS